MDAAVITCRRDLPYLRLLLASYVTFCKLEGQLLIFCDADDVDAVRAMPTPERCRVIVKDEICELGNNDYLNQMYIKLNLDKFSGAEYFWSLDSDYVLVDYVYEEDFFENDRPVWIYRPWDNEPSLRWKSGTSEILGFEPPFQFMDRAQFVLIGSLLKNLRGFVDIRHMFDTATLPSEFMVYASYCHRFHESAYVWRCLPDCMSSLSYNVTQRAPTYSFDDRTSRLSDAETSKYCVFWSLSDHAELKMAEFFEGAVSRRSQSNPPLDPGTAIKAASLRLVDGLTMRLQTVEADRKAKDEVIDRVIREAAAVEADRKAKDEVITRLTAEIDVLNADRKAKDEVIDRVIREAAAVEADRKAKDEVITRLTAEIDVLNADRKAKDEVIDRVIREAAAVEADRKAKDEVITRLTAEIDVLNADRKAKDEVIDRVIREAAAVEADRKAKDEVITRLTAEIDVLNADRKAKDEVIDRVIREAAAVEADLPGRLTRQEI